MLLASGHRAAPVQWNDFEIGDAVYRGLGPSIYHTWFRLIGRFSEAALYTAE